MRSSFSSNHFSDAEGNPAGGTTFGQGFAIGWQNGPLGRGEDRKPANGAFVEDIIAAAVDRLKFYQNSKFKCDENHQALVYLVSALDVLDTRTKERESRGVEGTHVA